MLSRESSLTVLNRTHAFPGPYVFRVIGDNGPELVASALQVVVWVLGRRAMPDVALRASARGRHLSVSVRALVPDARRVLDIYRGLRCLSGVRFIL